MRTKSARRTPLIVLVVIVAIAIVGYGGYRVIHHFTQGPGNQSSHAVPTATPTLPTPRNTKPAESRPSGADIVGFEKLPTASTLQATISSAPHGDQVSFLPGTFSFTNFAPTPDKEFIGVDLHSGVTGLRGSGSASTIFEMVPHSSTHAKNVPTQRRTTNQLSLIRLQNGSPTLSGFTLLATPQGHLYNGLRIQRTKNAHISDVVVAGVPGNAYAPPGETFGINDYKTDGSVYSNIVIDGQHVSAANFGANSSSNVTIKNSSFYDTKYSAGVTFWQTKNISISNSKSTNNHTIGYNFERVSGTVMLDHITTTGNRWGAIRFASDRGSAKVTIVDPVFSGPKFVIIYPVNYIGGPNTQKKSDIRLIINGVDRTKELVRYKG